jgi:hypothetical protein
MSIQQARIFSKAHLKHLLVTLGLRCLPYGRRCGVTLVTAALRKGGPANA